ncbi:MAG: RNA polymerase sigma factor [Bacteroidota bacterium]
MNRDDEYIRRVLSGESNAFRYLIELYKDMAFNIAVSIVKDDQFAEEVVQDSFLKAFNGLKSFQNKSKFKSWFYRIVVNESFQRFKKLKRDQSMLEYKTVNDQDAGGEQEKLENQTEQISRLLRLLPANESLALNLFYLEENSLKDISDITGWTLANVKVILHRARKNVRSQFNKQKNNA